MEIEVQSPVKWHIPEQILLLSTVEIQDQSWLQVSFKGKVFSLCLNSSVANETIVIVQMIQICLWMSEKIREVRDKLYQILRIRFFTPSLLFQTMVKILDFHRIRVNRWSLYEEFWEHLNTGLNNGTDNKYQCSTSQASKLREPWTSRCSSWF